MAYGSGRTGGFRGGGFGRNFGPREMHKIKCSECGKDSEVPFKPREGTPVYCRECFFKKKGITPRFEKKEKAKNSEEFGEEAEEVEEAEGEGAEENEEGY